MGTWEGWKATRKDDGLRYSYDGDTKTYTASQAWLAWFEDDAGGFWQINNDGTWRGPQTKASCLGMGKESKVKPLVFPKPTRRRRRLNASDVLASRRVTRRLSDLEKRF